MASKSDKKMLEMIVSNDPKKICFRKAHLNFSLIESSLINVGSG